MPNDQPRDPRDAFAELGRIRIGETGIDQVLGRIALLAKQSIPQVSEASVTLTSGHTARTAASTGDVALTLDEWQYQHDRGPCLCAAVTTTTLLLPDMSTEDRWPDYARRAVEAGVHSSLSVGMPVHETVAGAINLYAATMNGFDNDAIVVAQNFSEYAAVASANAHRYDTAVTLAQHLQAALQHRAVIEQAKGIIMGSRLCTADEAFVILRKVSRDTNRKLRDVAAALVARAERRN